MAADSSAANPPRYEVISTRTTARGSSYGVYDNFAKRVLPDTTSRDRREIAALVKRMNSEARTEEAGSNG